MPRTEIAIESGTYVLDARPDRIDHRDRPYYPRLISLPDRWPTERDISLALPYFENMVLDQGQEGACTGFGLASVINYVLWRDLVLKLPRGERGLLAIDLDQVEAPIVSPFQLYHLARIYDEWEGEDYEGSSCRGAVKGFHKHGVCLRSLWPDKEAPGDEGRQLWQQDAAQRPLGAYYRIDRLSINDVQSAIYEVGAVYVSASIHAGWQQVAQKSATLPFIRGGVRAPVIGAHAFAVIGYEPRGFIVQNSWGNEWGYHGFALLPYDDWAKNGMDAWVAVRGAITSVAISNENERTSPWTDSDPKQRDAVPVAALQSFRMDSLATASTRQPGWLWTHTDSQHDHQDTSPLSREEAYGLSLVLENDGRVVSRRVGFDSVAQAVDEIGRELPQRWFSNHSQLSGGKQRIVIYFHGGLNSEQDAMRRVEVMAPYFLSNGVYPIFIAWRTSFFESILGILEDSLHRFFQPPTRATSIGWADAINEQISEATDRAIEVACQHLLVKPVWSQMKQNGAAAVSRGKGLALLLDSLQQLCSKLKSPELHLIGHSAGAIPIGHWLAPLARRGLPLQSCRLLAPACTVDFANRAYAKALSDGSIQVDKFYLHALTDELEQLDRVGPYGKSLLYLVSRALEENHKEPILGMHWVHEPDVHKIPQDAWYVPPSRRNRERVNPEVEKWRSETATLLSKGQVSLHGERFISDGARQTQQTHGSFDNNVTLLNLILRDLTGHKPNPPVTNLHY